MKDTPLFFPAVQILFPDNLMQIVREKNDKNEEKNDNNVEKNYENVVVDENMRPAISFYLAAEEYVAQHFADRYGACYFVWITPPSVIVGRHQVLKYEVNLDVLSKKHIQLIRRKSGGGAVLSDGNNLMTSLVLGKQYSDLDIDTIFHKYAEGNIKALQKFGIEATISGRNDILLGKDGEYGKVSGNAFYKQRDHNIVHGTMLYDADVNLMADVLLPDDDKLKFKGVKSVRSRVCTIRKYFEKQGFQPEQIPSQAEVMRAFPDTLCKDSVMLTEDDVRNIRNIERTYQDVAYLYGHQAEKEQIVLKKRFDGCGKICISLHTENDVIDSVNVSGDFFEIQSGAALSALQILKGHRPYKEELLQAVENLDTTQAIRGFKPEMIRELICQLGE